MKTLSNVLATGAVAAALSFTGIAQAATISGGSFSFPRQVTDIDQTGSLNKFDTGLGTLTQVSLTVTGEYLQSFTANNSSAQTQNARVISAIDLIYSIVGGPALSSDTLTFSANTGFLSYAPGETKSFGPFAANDFINVTFTAPADLAFFSGLGTFDVNCFSASGTTITGGGGNINTTQDTTAACGASVEYTYTAAPVGTPEPTMVLGLLAVGGAGAFARRKG
ncbi:choice-of-anchor E domain-containing protein [Pannus brasiliensis CCIBt3594]|uniref:Choice-of-anchor E domain-containing protein n=1 Tax=Pannus brasiliensis CCIBt3594 TaxID=1427578 RepID=A0AAW9QWG4_9CHRO